MSKKQNHALNEEEHDRHIQALVIADAVDSLAYLDEEELRLVFRQVFKRKAFKNTALELTRMIFTLADHAPTTSGRGQQEHQKQVVQAPKKEVH